jgi:hypothetical protein
MCGSSRGYPPAQTDVTTYGLGNYRKLQASAGYEIVKQALVNVI